MICFEREREREEIKNHQREIARPNFMQNMHFSPIFISKLIAFN